MSHGLRIMRRIDPDTDLEAALDALGQLHEIQDRSGRVWKYVSDDDFRPTELNLEITGGWDAQGRITHRPCTLGFAIMDETNDVRAFVSRADHAARVLASATVTVTTDIGVEFDEPTEEEGDDGPDLPEPAKPRKAA